MKIDRLIGILSILLQEEKTTAPELAEKFEVSSRTINRDIEDLCKVGIPVRTAQGTGGGISIMDGYCIDRTRKDFIFEKFRKKQRLGRNGIENLCIKPTSNYCTGEEQFTFFKLPKCLIDDACFLGLSIDAKLLYAIFLDRVSLSIKNGWVDENGRVFIYYSVINICEILNCGTQKACKLLDELETFGALERRRQELGKPNKLYLKKVF